MRAKTILAIGLSLILAACSSKLGAGTDVCAGPSPAAGCGDTCVEDADCGSPALRCGVGGECEARPTDASPDAGVDTCPAIAVRAEPVTPTVVLLIDQSGSMTSDFGGPTRWEAVTDAIGNPTTGVVKQLEDKVIFGATLYSSIGGNAGGTCPMLVEVAPALNNHTAIKALLDTHQPQSDTPTAESITATTAGFPLPDPEKPGPRILVLATDGNPDNCVDANAHDLGSQRMSESAVQAAYSAGISTYVLSVGDGVAATHLQKLANAGVGIPLDTGTAPFYVANDPAQLASALGDIIRGARTCTFTLEGTVNLGSAATGSVELNGQPLAYGTDWRMVDETTLELIGAACDTFLDTDTALLTAEFPCGAVVL